MKEHRRMNTITTKRGALSASLLNLYIETALPGGSRCLGQRFHAREWWMRNGWIERPNPFTTHRCERLTREHVRDHLAGRRLIAPRWPADVDCIEIDIDAKDEAARLTLEERLYGVMGALDARSTSAQLEWRRDPYEGRGIGIIWQSSRGGGLRYRIPLNDLHPAVELRERTLEALERAGLTVTPGRIEIFPDGQRPCRLPLGSGFHFMDDAFDFLPGFVFAGYGDRVVAGCKRRGARLVRDVPWSVRLWARMVAARRLPLELVFGRPRVFSVPPCATLDVKKDRGVPVAPSAEHATSCAVNTQVVAASSGPNRGGRRGYWAVIRELEESGAPAEGRFEAMKALTFAWRIGVGLPSPAVLSRLRDWLDTAPHASKDLTSHGREKVKTSMLKSAESRLAQLDADIRNGKYRPGAGRAASASVGAAAHSPGMPVPTLSLRKERNTPEPKRWRLALVALLDEADRAAVTSEPDERTRRALSVLLASLRKLQAAHPTATTVAIPRGVLRTIMGGGSRRFQNAVGEHVTPYKFLVERAQALGILGPLKRPPSREAHRASIFGLPAVTLVNLGGRAPNYPFEALG
jgi:hypothetical protein